MIQFQLIARPVDGSMTQARGQKANIHVYKEILELCYIIESAGEIYSEDTPELKAIPFGELFNVKSIMIRISTTFSIHNIESFQIIDLLTHQQ